MSNAILELGRPQTEKGVSTRHLWIAGSEDRRVPALVLTPEDASGPRPVIMLGHGAGGSKDEPQMQSIARWLVRREGWAVAVIDGPVHGERRPEGVEQVGLRAREVLTDRETYDAMAVDWQRTVDACAELPDVGIDRAAYLGFSMGTVLGVPSVAAEERFRCAVFAIGGVIGNRPGGLAEAARTITRPVLMINQTEDEIFSRESAFQLYDALSGPKRVFFYPGGHTAVPREAMERVREFLHAHLAGEGVESGAPRGAW
ncbi:MAG: dienelactone hydrolase family protein [Dehalococcoidia bacterium]